jgi:hypothetical protein
MIRTQIQLSESQLRRLKAAAAARGVSLAELVRRGVDVLLAAGAREAGWKRLGSAVGSCRDRSGARDVARRHDRYLAEAWGGENRIR